MGVPVCLFNKERGQSLLAGMMSREAAWSLRKAFQNGQLRPCETCMITRIEASRIGTYHRLISGVVDLLRSVLAKCFVSEQIFE